MEKIKFEDKEIIKIILNYLKSHNFDEAYEHLVRDSGVVDVDNINFSEVEKKKLEEMILSGRWGEVFSQIKLYGLSQETNFKVYKLVITELVTEGSTEIAVQLINSYLIYIFNYDQIEKLRSLLKTKSSPKPNYFSGLRKEICYLLFNEIEEKLRSNQESQACNYLGRDKNLINYLNKAYLYDCGIHNISPISLQSNIIDNQSTLNRHIKLVDLNLKSFDIKEEVSTIIKASQSESLYIGHLSGSITLHDCSDATKFLKYSESSGNEITTLGLSNDENILAAGNHAGQVLVFKASTLKILRKFSDFQSKSITSVLLTNDNSMIISGSLDTTIVVIGLKSSSLLYTLSNHSSFITSIIITNKSLVTMSSSGECLLWNSSFIFVKPIELPFLKVKHIVKGLKTAESIFIIGYNQLFELSFDGELTRVFDFTFYFNAKIDMVTLLIDMSALVVVNEDRALYIIDTKTMKLIADKETIDLQTVYMDYSKEIMYIATPYSIRLINLVSQ